jgi:carboxylate-amine ligase
VDREAMRAALRGGQAGPMTDWARWTQGEPWTVGLEEEVMLLEPDGSPAWRSEDVLELLDERHARGETHGLALEIATDPHASVGAAASQLRHLRAGVAEAVRSLGLCAAVAGTHPTARSEEVEVSPGARYQYLHATMRELARREPTFALHVHVAVPDPELAIRAFDGMRHHIPVLLALSANSPFTRGVDTGLASARTPVFQAFPRTGLPRAFGTYGAYVEAIDVLLRCGAIPEPTFIWWDLRLQPRFGTLELRVMDAQTRIRDSAALAALVQCLVRLEALDGFAEPEDVPEAMDENRFLAARDGIDAELLDARRGRRVPAAGRLATLVDACWPHARALGCERELALLAHLAGDPGAVRQRAIAREAGLQGLVHALCGDFSPPRPRLALAA